MIGLIISGFITFIINYFIWQNLSKFKIEWKKIKTWLIILFGAGILILNSMNPISILKVITAFLLCIISYKFLFNCTFKESIAIPMIVQLVYIIVETIYTLILFIILKDDVEKFVENFVYSTMSNLAIPIFVFFICKLKVVRILYNKFNKLIYSINKSVVFILSILIILIYTIFAVNVYNKMNPKLLLFMSLVIASIYFILTCIYFKTKRAYLQVSERYNSSLISLKQFETVLGEYRINNHENKNQLMTIRNMSNNKKIRVFVDTLLDNRLADKDEILNEVSDIPSSMIRGLIYAKLLVMHSKDIDYELNIASNVRIVDFSEYGDDVVVEMCQILGVFLDNAIEEVSNIADKYVIVDVYKEDNSIFISVANTYDNTIDKDKIYEAGYSTKGKGHGFGLALVKRVVTNNPQLVIHHEQTECEFTQIVELKKKDI